MSDKEWYKCNYYEQMSKPYFEEWQRPGLVSARRIAFDIVIPMFCFSVGLIQNILCIIALNRERPRRTTNFLLQLIAIFDLWYLFLCFLPAFQSLYNFWHIDASFMLFFQKFMDPYNDFLRKSSKGVSLYLTLFVAIERYIAVKYPLRAKNILTLKRAMIISTIMIIITHIFLSPKLIAGFYPLIFYDSCASQWRVKLYEPTALALYIRRNYFFLSKILVFITDQLGYATFTILMPIICLICMNLLSLREFFKAKRLQRQMVHSKTEVNATASNENTEFLLKIILLVTFVILSESLATIFIFGEGLKVIPPIFYGYNWKNIEFWNKSFFIFVDKVQRFFWMNSIYYISTGLQMFNALTNFYIYIIAGKKFRTIVFEIIMCKELRSKLSSKFK